MFLDNVADLHVRWTEAEQSKSPSWTGQRSLGGQSG